MRMQGIMHNYGTRDLHCYIITFNRSCCSFGFKGLVYIK
uniref:Uncharacterized protein n=1 Tax=Anguilla anguilla TaxID=7936 RepID=A0A0E9SIE8_ANGAN